HGHPPRAVHREDPTRHLPGNDRSDRILFTPAGLHHHRPAADGRGSPGMVAASNKTGLIPRNRRRHRPPLALGEVDGVVVSVLSKGLAHPHTQPSRRSHDRRDRHTQGTRGARRDLPRCPDGRDRPRAVGRSGHGGIDLHLRDGPRFTPVDAFFIIIAVITASAAMHAAGGIDFLVTVASKIIRRNPRHITYVAPLVAFVFTVGAGTSNI